MAVLLAEAIVDAGNVLVVKLREHIGFALEADDRLVLQVGIADGVNHLGQGAGTARQTQILGQIDHLHPAAAEQPGNAIAVANDGIGSNHCRFVSLFAPFPEAATGDLGKSIAPPNAALAMHTRCSTGPIGPAEYAIATPKNHSAAYKCWPLYRCPNPGITLSPAATHGFQSRSPLKRRLEPTGAPQFLQKRAPPTVTGWPQLEQKRGLTVATSGPELKLRIPQPNPVTVAQRDFTDPLAIDIAAVLAVEVL